MAESKEYRTAGAAREKKNIASIREGGLTGIETGAKRGSLGKSQAPVETRKKR